MRLYILFSLRISLICVDVHARLRFGFVKNACRWHWAANYYTRRIRRALFRGQLQVSKALDRARKLHGYRISAYVRLGSKGDIGRRPDHICFTPKNGHRRWRMPRSFCAINGRGLHYSITSSAPVSSAGGTVRPSTLAVLRLSVISNFVGCMTGKSAGLWPFNIRPQ
jgi:hypothetical protein